MMRFTLLLLASAALSIAQDGTPLDHDPTLQEMAGKRDLRSYDDGGEIRDARLDAEQLSKLREFIWNHWRQKKRGYVRFTDSYVDSWNQAFIFIEPSDLGQSHIIIRSVHGWAGGGVVRRDLTDLPEVVSVKQAKPQKEDYGGDYVLVFRDNDGKIVKRL